MRSPAVCHWLHLPSAEMKKARRFNGAVLVAGLLATALLAAPPQGTQPPHPPGADDLLHSNFAEIPKKGAAEKLPPPTRATVPSETAPAPHVVPINLETVFRLAEDQNVQVSLARAKVAEAASESDLASKRWLPDLFLGTGWYRHEGGIQLQEGPNIHSSMGALLSGVDLSGRMDLRELVYQNVNAERKAWQQKGELSRITSEALLEATSTYVDLLAARSAEAIARELLKNLKDLQKRADILVETDQVAHAEAARVRAEVSGREQSIRRLQSQAEAASARLVYLLGMDPCIQLVPIDPEIFPVELVDVSQPACALVAQALANGPGIRELESMVALVEDAAQRARGPGRFLPIVHVRMNEGAFGAGPGPSLTYDNRWDLFVEAGWNLTELLTANERRHIADAQRQQVHLAYQDLRAKLTASVQEAREAILSGSDEIRLGREQVRHAAAGLHYSKTRLRNMVSANTITDMLLSLQTVSGAQLGHLAAIRDYDKAQLRLVLLISCR